MCIRDRDNVDLHIEVGGGIRDMETVEHYLSRGVSRVILGSAALRDPAFVREAVKKYGKKIAVGIDALDGKVAADGWTEQSQVDYIEPVSYTHLDVYKRQALISVGKETKEVTLP